MRSTEAEVRTIAGRRPAVLIVEDEQIVAMDLAQTLSELGYDACGIAATSDEAVRHVAERCPDLIMMDIRIKGQRDGIDTARILRERFDIPIVYLTAHADEATVERARTTTPHGYLLKPVSVAELRSSIEISLYRAEMERRVRERQKWFSTTLDSITDAVITVDLAGRVSFMNPAAEKLTGTDAAQVTGRPAAEVIRLLDSRELTELDVPIEQVLRNRAPVTLGEATLVARDNARRLISDRFAPVTDAERLLGAVMVFRDITEQRLNERQLELADRLASLGTMAAGVAHEVNNPLITNAFKHGFPDSRRGTITLVFAETDDDLVLEVGDDGVGLPPGFDTTTANSLGVRLVSSLARQLDARLEVTRAPTRFVLRMRRASGRPNAEL